MKMIRRNFAAAAATLGVVLAGLAAPAVAGRHHQVRDEQRRGRYCVQAAQCHGDGVWSNCHPVGQLLVDARRACGHPAIPPSRRSCGARGRALDATRVGAQTSKPRMVELRRAEGAAAASIVFPCSMKCPTRKHNQSLRRSRWECGASLSRRLLRDSWRSACTFFGSWV